MKKIASLIAAVVLLLAVSVSVFAEGKASASAPDSSGKEYTIPELAITVRIPENMYVFQKDRFSYTDPAVSKAGITDVAAFAEKFNNYNLLLDAFSEDGLLEVGFYKKESDDTRSYYNLGELSEEEYAEFLKTMQPSEEFQQENGLKMQVEDYKHPETRYFITRIEMDKTETYDHSISEICYATIVNGYTITVDAVVLDGKITKEHEALLEEIVNSIHITEVIDKEKAGMAMGELTPQDYFTVYGSLILIIGVIAAMIATYMNRRRRDRERRLLADRLSQYRFEEQERETSSEEGSHDEPESFFRNRTEYNDAAVKSFASYHVGHKRLLAFVLYTLVAAAFLLFAAFSNLEAIMRILLVILAGFILVWECMMPGKLKKAQTAVFKKSVHKWNEYSFRKRDFRVTGMQSSTLYPYFQITHVGESKDYFFLYFGEETAYYVAKDGFTEGKAEEFLSFIKERIKQA